MITLDEQLFLDGSYFFSCIRNAARFTKKGRGTLQNDVAATLQVLDNRVLVDRHMPGHPNGHAFDIDKAEPPPREEAAPVYLDVRSVKNPNSKGRNVRYRVAASPGWSCSFNVLWDKTLVNRAQMEGILNDAGVLVGLADARAIGFGRFQVERFEIAE